MVAFARRLDEVKWVSLDEIGDITRRLQKYDHPDRFRRAKRRRNRDPNAETVRELPLSGPDDTTNWWLLEPLRDDWMRLLQEWDQWNDAKRLVCTIELAARLIIENTKPGRPYLLEYAPPASEGDLSADYLRVGQARHEGLEPYDFDIRNSSIRSPGGSWLPARIRRGIEAEAECMRLARLAGESGDTEAAAAWKAECAKPMRERRYFRCGDIADALAKAPESLEVDAAKRDRIVRDLGDWIIRGEFDLSGKSDVVVLSGEPPYFLPVGPVPPDGILADPERLILRRDACRRYFRDSSLYRASRLLTDWFPEAASPSSRGPAVNPKLRAAIEDALETEGIPGRTVPWKRFCDRVRLICGVVPNVRGYGDKSIERAVRGVKAETDKHDKSDMSDMS